jgi:hypothetical protein
MIKNRNKKWTVEDIEKLKELYPDNTNKHISAILHRSEQIIAGKASELGIKKSHKHRSKMSVLQNIINLKTITQFIEESNKTHVVGEYDYINSIYKGAHQLIEIKHNKCGKIFAQMANTHVRGGGCSFCNGNEKRSNITFKISGEEKYGDLNNYDLVDYKNAKTPVKIKCNKHDIIFEQDPYSHLHKNTGCLECSMESRRLKSWPQDKIDILIKLYPSISNEELMVTLNKSKCSIVRMAHILKLKKNRVYLSNLRRDINIKLKGRNLDYQKVKEIALKFKSRQEFGKLDSFAYDFARKNGYLDDVCSHMLKINVSAPQLMLQTIMDGVLNKKSMYNTRQIIKPFEIDVYYPEFKLAFEYQGIHWHGKDNTRDAVKLQRMKDLNINLIYIMEISKQYEIDIKNQLISNLTEINRICNTSILPEDILNFNIGNVYEKIHNKDTLFAIARTYDSYKEFRKIEKSVCYKLDIMGWLKPATDHMKDKKKKLTMEMVLEKIKKYNTLQDFMVNDRSAYEFINRNKMKHLVSHLSRGHYDIDFTLEDVKTRINQYTTKWEFTKENPRMYEYLRSRRLTYLISNLKSLK